MNHKSITTWLVFPDETSDGPSSHFGDVKSTSTVDRLNFQYVVILNNKSTHFICYLLICGILLIKIYLLCMVLVMVVVVMVVVIILFFVYVGGSFSLLMKRLDGGCSGHK